MADKAELLAEAYRRGLLPPDKRAAYEEAQRRGLISGAQRRRSAVENVTGFMANVNRGLGIGDEMAAGAQTAVNLFAGRAKLPGTMTTADLVAGRRDIVQDFKRNMAAQRQIEDTFAAEKPRAAALGRGTGMAATVAVPAGNTANLFAQSGRAVNAARAATLAGAQGAAYAAADRGTAAERLGAAAEAARDPLTLGLGAVGGAAASPRKARAPKAKAPSVEQLRRDKTAAYQAVENAGVTYTPQAMKDLIRGVTDDARAASINPQRHPRATSMLRQIQKLRRRSPTLTQLDQLRQVIRRDVANATDPAEAFFGRRMIDGLDEFIDAAGAAQVKAGDPERAASTIRQARDLNTRVRKIEAVEDAVESARLRAGSTGSGGNIDNATRQNLRRVLENTRNLTDEERAALESIVVGTRGQNLLRQVGKLSPQGNGLMTALSIGGAAANPLLAIPTATGAASKVAADAITQTKVKQLVDLIALGGSRADLVKAERDLAGIAASDPAAAALRKLIAEKLARMAAVSGSAPQPAPQQPTNFFAQP